MNHSSVSHQIARSLLEIEAIKLSPSSPFTWSSGWKSPIYCDNRLSLSFPEIRTLVKESLAKEIEQRYPNVESIAGVATAGIPQGALVADILGLPFIYVRTKPKGHGMENLIEGKPVPGQQVVVIEDLISTGGSSLKAIEELRRTELEVLGLGAIFTYGFSIALQSFREAKVDFFTLTDYDILLMEALQGNYISTDQVSSLRLWNKDPENWYK